MSKGRYPIGVVVNRKTGEMKMVYRENGTDEEFLGILRNLLRVAEMIEEFDAEKNAREQRQLLPDGAESTAQDSSQV